MDELETVKEALSDTNYSIDDYLYVKNKMMDEKSKKMLFNRVMLDTTNDAYYSLLLQKEAIAGMGFNKIHNKIMYQHLQFLLKDNNYKKKIYVLGFSDYKIIPRCDIWQSWEPLNIICVFEKINIKDEFKYDATGGKYVDVVSFDRVDDYDFKNSILIVGNPNYIELSDELIRNNKIPKENVFKFYISPTEDIKIEYFSEEFLNIGEDDVFIDGGAYKLETSKMFSDWSYGRYKKIYAFEPIKEQYDICIKVMNHYNLHDIELFNLGLSNEKKQLKYDNLGASSREDENGTTIVNLDSIDNILDGEKATIIKLDIEGAEEEAIIGAKKTIKKYEPTLIICVYHKPLDILKLAKLVLSYNDKYKLYLRHSRYTLYETVLYFII